MFCPQDNKYIILNTLNKYELGRRPLKRKIISNKDRGPREPKSCCPDILNIFKIQIPYKLSLPYNK